MKKTLRLHRETLRDLTQRELRSVVGGATEAGGQMCDTYGDPGDPNYSLECGHVGSAQITCNNNPSELDC